MSVENIQFGGQRAARGNYQQQHAWEVAYISQSFW
jgi:hypothetical protein